MKLEELFNSLKLQSEGNSGSDQRGHNRPPPPTQTQNPNQNFVANDEFASNANICPLVEPPPGLFTTPQANVPFSNVMGATQAMSMGEQSSGLPLPSFAHQQPFFAPMNGHFVPFPAMVSQPFGAFPEHPPFMAPPNFPLPPLPVPFPMISPIQFLSLPPAQQHQIQQELQQQQQQQMQQQMAYQQNMDQFYSSMAESTQNNNSLASIATQQTSSSVQMPVIEKENADNVNVMLSELKTGHNLKNSNLMKKENERKEERIDKVVSSPANNVTKKSIRVNVNDLFSLSKVYSETNSNLDANRILFDILQKQEIESKGKLTNNSQVATANSEKMTSTFSTEIFQELTNLNENYCTEILKQLRIELQTTSDSIIDIMSNHEGLRERNYIFTMIKQYFQHISQRMQMQNVTYLNLIDFFQYNYDDFASYGPRFRDFIQNSQLFNENCIKEYTTLLQKYEQFYPTEIITLRKILLKMKLTYSECLKKQRLAQAKANKKKLLNENSSLNEQQTQSEKLNEMITKSPIPIEYNMVTFQKVDSKNLHSSVSAMKSTKDQIKYFIERTKLSLEEERNRIEFLSCLDRALQNSEFAQFHPTLHKFGSLSNGMGTYDSDIDIVITLENLKIDVLDYGTLMLALEVIECILQEQLGIQARETIVPSKRCPIIKLNFSACFPQFKKNPETEFNKCDISLISSYGVYNSKLLHFLTKYDYRFRELSLILKYWAKRNELIDTTTFSSYGFTMLIIFFLQNTNPPVLPTVARLQELAKQQQGSEALIVNKFNFQFCSDINIVGKSKNTQSVPDLLLDFFRFYVKFDFYNNAVSPRLGTVISKFNMRKEKLVNNFDNFNMASYVCIEDPFVLEHNVGFIFRARNVQRFNTLLRSMIYKLTPNNCLKVLVDPKNFMSSRYCNTSSVFIPFNLFCYEVIINEHYLSYPIRYEAISLSAATHQVPLQKSFDSMQKLFYIIIRHLLVNYFAVADVENVLQLQFNEDNSIYCSIDFAYLNYINYKLDFRKNHKYDPLFQAGRKRSADALKRFSLLKMLRDDLRRPVMNESKERILVPSNIVENWFKLELPSHPPVHQLQLSSASFQSLLDANQQTVLPYFHYRMQVQSTAKNYNVASRFGELLQEILQKFCFSIDRVNAISTFESQIKEFFEN